MSLEFHSETQKLREDLFQRQSERIKLKVRLDELTKSNKQAIRLKAASLQRSFQRFIILDKASEARNERILRELKRVQTQASILATRSEKLKISQEKYKRELDRSKEKVSFSMHRSNVYFEELPSLFDSLRQPINQSTPKKKDQFTKSEEMNLNDSHLQQKELFPIEVNDEQLKGKSDHESNFAHNQVFIPKPTPPPRIKKNKSRNNNETTSSSEMARNVITEEITTPEISLNSSAVKRRNAQKHLVTKDDISKNGEEEIKLKDGALSMELLSSPNKHSLLESQVEIEDSSVIFSKNATSNYADSLDDVSFQIEEKNVDASGKGNSKETAVTSSSMSLPGIDASLSSDSSSSSCGAVTDSTSDITPSNDSNESTNKNTTLEDIQKDNIIPAKESLDSENPEVPQQTISRSNSDERKPISDKNSNEIISKSDSDDDFFNQKPQTSTNYDSIIGKSVKSTSSIVDELDDDLENELAAALSGHSILDKSKSNISPTEMENNVDSKVSGQLSSSKETEKSSNRKQIDDKLIKTTRKPPKQKWEIGDDSDEDISFGNSISIPGVDSEDDDSDFYK